MIAFSSMLAGQAADPSSVEGQVINAGNGEPLRGAVVTLQRTSGRAARPGEPPQPPGSNAEVESDEQGRFAFRGLEAGGYRISARRQGFIDPNQAGANFPNSQLWLGEGQQLTGYMVRVTAQSVIAGKVLDEYGDPVTGAQVFARRAAGSAIPGRPAMAGGSVQSNDLGEYRIANLSAGDYVVAAALPVYRIKAGPQLIYATTYHPGTAVASKAAPVHVADGAVAAGIDIKLAKVNTFTIRGTVVDPDAPANARAYPQLRPRDGDGFPGGGFFAPSVQQDGSFTIPNVPPGSYDLVAQRRNPGTPGPSVAGAVVPIEVRDKNLDGIVLQVKPNSDLQGTVKLERPGECDLRNMSVSLRPANGVYSLGMQPAAVADDLKFTLKNVPAGVYSIDVTGGMSRCYVKSIEYGGQAAPQNALAVTESGPLEIMLASYSAMLNVTVVDSDGNPLPRARIVAVPKEGGNPTMSSMTGLNGQMNTLARPGTYQVYAWEAAAQYAPPTPEYLKAFESRAKTVTVAATGRASVEVAAIPASESGAMMPPPPPPGAKGSLAGTVVNAVSGAPIAGVAVSLGGQFNFTNQPQAMRGTVVAADDQGRFSFPDLTPGSYTLAPARPGESLFHGQVIVGEGQQISVYVLKLIPGGVIAGAVKDESGEPVLGARVEVSHYRTDFAPRRLVTAGSTQTDDLGKYRIANLPPGNYFVDARMPGAPRTAAESAMGLASAPAAPPPPPESIAGPLPTEPETDYVPVSYSNASQPSVASAVRITRPPGAGVFRASPSQPSAASAVRVTAGAAVANIDMTMRKTRVVRIRGRVVDPSGGPVGTPSVTLMAKNADAMPPSVGNARVALDGAFEITGVPPGSYNLVARPGPIGDLSGGGAVMNVGGIAMSGGIGMGGVPPIRIAVQSVEVKESPIEGIRLELGPGRTVKGTIKMDGGGAAGQGVLFFNLTSLPAVGSGRINFGSGGTFTVTGVFPLVYTLNAQNLSANSYIKSIRYAGREVPESGIEFTGPGELEVTISNAAAVLEGSVTGGDGKPMGNAGVVVAPSSGSLPMRTGNADAHGNFYFGSLPPGDYRVLAWDATTPEASDPPASLGPFASAAKTVKLAENAHEKVRVTVVPAGR
ncbi:MAG: carboxypeptidase-like regulatory domain-containing protein [Bryobacteraceae bacterium]